MELRVNLKVCEGCGCLWYRAQVETRVYCTSCQERFKDFPTAQSRKRRGRPRKTILPAVFAVETPASFSWASQNRSAFANPAKSTSTTGLSAATREFCAAGFALPEGMLATAHLPADAAVFAGGAQ
jgi:hypothetical protein